MRFKILIIILIAFLNQSLFAQNIRVAIFYAKNPKSLEFNIVNGNYSIYIDDSIYNRFEFPFQCKINHETDKISILINDEIIYAKSKILFNSETKSEFSLKLESAGANSPRSYEGNLEINHTQTSLLAINIIELESYVAAVVEAEGGYNKPKEFYKAQAIITRTYVLKNFNKHIDEGFEICDGTHCQVYKKACKQDAIISAVNATKGLILVDNNYELILATYHSNSGGTTMNSEDVWLSELSYLRSIDDEYFEQGRNTFWERTILLSEWKNFLKTKSINTEVEIGNILINDTLRLARAEFQGISFPLTEVRHYFKLPSAFFSMSLENNQINISGKGYGHGVGLSQESAMQMALEGKNYKDILSYFYTGVHVVNMRTLSVFNSFIESGK